MKYRDLQIQTQREAPNNARTEGFAFLVRAGYLTRENVPTKLGEYAINHLRALSTNTSFSLANRTDQPGQWVPGGASVFQFSLPTIGNERETFFATALGSIEIIHCPGCKYTERFELARLAKVPLPHEAQLPLEKVLTPDCNTIEALVNFLGIPKEKTAKALMYTRISDGKFIFVVVRGDMQLSEEKLKQHVGELRPATIEEIKKAGAVAGYASSIGLKEAVIVVDDLIPEAQNLVAGANEAGYHFKNTNYGRDYSAKIVGDLTQARAGDPCPNCGKPLHLLATISLAKNKSYNLQNILLALAETHHDSKGLMLPHPVVPFNVYLMHIPGKDAQSADTRAAAEETYSSLQNVGISVLFDDRDERAGVKFNDADLIGCPIRITVGAKSLKDGMVELKPRNLQENRFVQIEKIVAEIKTLLK